MPVFRACFLPALFAVMQRYKDCVNEQKEMPAFIPFLASIYIMYARTFIISYSYNKLLLFRMYALHALKGHKLLAQGIALGYYRRKPVAL